MSATQNQTSLQWMVEVGVPQADVAWLAQIAGSPHRHHPAMLKRVEEINDKAFKGLMATFVTSPTALA